MADGRASVQLASATIVPVRAARSARLSPQARALASVAALIAAGAVGTAGLVGGAVHLLAASWARRQLGLTFPGLAVRDASEFWRVFGWNLWHLAAPLAAAGIVWLRDPGARPAARALSGAWEALVGLFVALEVASNIAYIALAFGGYGLRTAWWLAPHGPLELAAYATALAIWAQALRGRLTVGLGLRAAAVSMLLLAVAAGIETAVR